ncbi:MAG: hypothetical protein ACFFBD_27015, partial [Candidatus Hodarchaeota archaeon]
ALPIIIGTWNEVFKWETLQTHPLIKRVISGERDLYFPPECISCSNFPSCQGGCIAFTLSSEEDFSPILSKKKDPYCPMSNKS